MHDSEGTDHTSDRSETKDADAGMAVWGKSQQSRAKPGAGEPQFADLSLVQSWNPPWRMGRSETSFDLVECRCIQNGARRDVR